MKVRLERSSDTGQWYEPEPGGTDIWQLIELPDAIVTEWRALTKRLAEIEDYFDERVPPLLAKVKIPPQSYDDGFRPPIAKQTSPPRLYDEAIKRYSEAIYKQAIRNTAFPIAWRWFNMGERRFPILLRDLIKAQENTPSIR